MWFWLSTQYFNEIKAANNQFKHLTVIPALEWNIPPFNGREHATVLLPESPRLKNDLSLFRNNFDHYQQNSYLLLDSTLALQWLNNNALYTKIAPIVIYNHPSRKDFQVSENKYDYKHTYISRRIN